MSVISDLESKVETVVENTITTIENSVFSKIKTLLDPVEALAIKIQTEIAAIKDMTEQEKKILLKDIEPLVQLIATLRSLV